MAEWRPMRESDMPAVLAVSVEVHPGFPEGEGMFRNRLALYPAGCLVLAEGEGALVGYAVSHPSRRYAPPPLDVILEALPAEADDYYVHDVALLPAARGGGRAPPASSGFWRTRGASARPRSSRSTGRRPSGRASASRPSESPT